MSKPPKPEPIASNGIYRLLPPYYRYTSYRIEWYDRDKVRTDGISTGTADIGKAQEAFARYCLENVRADPDQALRDEPAATAMSRYYLQHASKLPSAKAARYAMAAANECWKEALISQIDPAKQRQLIEVLRIRGLAESTISRWFTCIFAAFQHSVDEGFESKELVPGRLPKKKWGPRTAPRRRKSIEASKRALSLEEWAKLYDTTANSENGENGLRYLIIATGSGARPQAIAQLTTAQVNLDQRIIDFNPPGREQNNKYRPCIPMAPTLCDWVRSWNPRTPMGHYMGFAGSSLLKGNHNFFRDYIERAQIPNCTPYTLRHSIFSWLAAHGIDRWERKRFMGHKRPDQGSTDDYTHYEPQYLRKAAECIQSLFEAIAPLTSMRVNLLRRSYEDQPLPLQGLNNFLQTGDRLMAPQGHFAPRIDDPEVRADDANAIRE